MAKQNTNLMVATYTSDFGNTYDSIPVKFSAQAPIPTGVYVPRSGGCSGAGLPFSPRYLLAKFPEGDFKYVVPNIGNILTLRTALVTAGAICVDLHGETWANLPSSVLPTPAPTFRSTPLAAAAIDGSGDKETGKFDYTSEVMGTQRIGYSFESQNTTFLNIQKSELTNVEAGGLGSRPKNQVITPRAFTLHGLVDDGTSYARLMPVSSVADLTDAINTAAPEAYYLSYVGESTRRLQDI
ncbi:MAG: hypothetical protein AAF652_13760 [Cyanobacteria bacterium P01_C01_bin.72]